MAECQAFVLESEVPLKSIEREQIPVQQLELQERMPCTQGLIRCGGLGQSCQSWLTNANLGDRVMLRPTDHL